MSQVPNRYFNSPWIADAAKNLSLAIAGDPERDAARLSQEQIRANMARQLDADILAREERGREQDLSDVYSRLLVANPDQKADIAGEGLRLRGNPDTIAKIWGKGSPQQLVQEEMLNDKFSNAFALQAPRIQAQIDNAIMADRTKRGIHGDNLDYKYYDSQLDFDAAQLREATKVRLAGLTKDGKPLNIPIGAKNQLLSLITEMAETAGGTIPDEKLNKIFVDSTDRWQTTRNPFTAATQAFEKEYGTHAQTRSGKKGPWPWSANQPDELISLEEQAQQQQQEQAAGAAAPTASAPEEDGGFLDALSSIVSGAVTSAPASNAARKPGTPAASPGAAPLSSAITRPPPRAYGGRGVTYVAPPVVSHGRGGVSSLATPSAPTTSAAPAAFASRSPDAEKYLLANPTNELKAAFQSKYGYLPPGL